jgi:hypothetical protein
MTVMKPTFKTSLLVLAGLLAGVSTAAAGDVRLVRIEHGRTVTYAYRPIQSETTVAFAAQRRGIGRQQMMQRSEKEVELARRDASNGPATFYYRPAQ